jgi:GNAT superfamily N-acetyltransferase
MDVVLRPAGPADLEFTYRTRRAAFRPHVERTGTWDEGEQRRLHERRFSEQDVRMVVHDGQDVGLVALAVEGRRLRLNQLFLLPGSQGRGIGRVCVRLILEEARTAGRSVTLRVLKVNPRARAFFEESGFRPVGETETHDLLESA